MLLERLGRCIVRRAGEALPAKRGGRVPASLDAGATPPADLLRASARRREPIRASGRRPPRAAVGVAGATGQALAAVPLDAATSCRAAGPRDVRVQAGRRRQPAGRLCGAGRIGRAKARIGTDASRRVSVSATARSAAASTDASSSTVRTTTSVDATDAAGVGAG